MKKFTFAKIASLVFVCAMLFCALAVTAFATDDTVEIVSNNMYFGEKYQLMYAVNAPEGATVTAKDSKGNAIDVVTFAEAPTATVNGVECNVYILAEGVAAQAIDEVITFTVEYNGVTASSNYSVLQYVYERLNVKNIAVEAEKAMFEAFLAFADAANVFIDKETGSFNDYVYVAAEGVTVNGVNPTGMYKAGDMPFANIDEIVYDDATQVVKCYIGEEKVDLDVVKAIVVADTAISVDVKVLDKCSEGHTWVAPTCEKAGYCESCGVEGEAVVDCKDDNGDFKCDFGCGNNVLPADGTALTIPEAIKVAMAAGSNYTTEKYYVTGIITEIASTSYGNMYIKDEAGNTFYVYGFYSADGETRYDSLSYKPTVGDEVTVYGVLGTYSNSAQMKNGWADEIVQHDHEYSDATCDEPAKCIYCGLTTGVELGHTEANAEGKCDRCGKDLEEAAKEVTVTMAYKGTTTGNMTGNNDAATVGLDASIFSVIGNKGSTNNNCGLNKAGQIRLYGNSSGGNGSYFTVSIAEGYTIKSIKISIGGTNGGIKITAGDTVLAAKETSKSTTVEYNVNGSEFKLQNVVTGSTTQVYILGIEITYAPN